MSIEELVTVYRTQFPVMARYDKTILLDSNGRVVPPAILAAARRRMDRCEVLEASERTVVHPGSGEKYTYDLPFSPLDREKDMRVSYAEFERRLASNSEKTP